MHCRTASGCALALLLLAACSENSNPVEPYYPLALVTPSEAPGNSAKPLYRLGTLATGQSITDVGFPDVLIPLRGRFYTQHLAAIESAEENRVVARLLGKDESCLLGAFLDETGWHWLDTGEVWSEETYTNWAPGEPGAGDNAVAIIRDGLWVGVVDGTVSCFVIELKPVPGG
jgi:hypothetical protein